jgi:Ni,Fe-hydrogenase I cytochrome b subunit
VRRHHRASTWVWLAAAGTAESAFLTSSQRLANWWIDLFMEGHVDLVGLGSIVSSTTGTTPT